MGGGGNTSSKGPSPGDTSLSQPAKTFAAGPQGGDYSPFQGVSPIEQGGYGATATAPTFADNANVGPSPSFQFGATTPFGADTTATSGAGFTGAPGVNTSPYATIAEPGGGAPLGTTGQSFGPSFTDAFGTAPAPTGAATPAGGGGGITAPSAPSGITAPLGPDPTQQGATASPIPSAGGTGTQGFSLENILGGLGKSVLQNPAGILAGISGLTYSVMSGKQISDAQQQLQQQASQLSPQGQQLMSYLSSGTLPEGLKASLDQATAAAKARIISNYANQGMNTDPTQNSALAQQLAIIDQQALISIAQMGQQLYQSGLQTAQLSSGLYTQLANLDQTQTQRTGQSIAALASALSPTRSATTK